MSGASPILIDARGHACPVPSLRLRRALAEAPDGARLRLLADDPMAAIDAPFLIKELGYWLEGQSKNGAILIFDVAKRAPPA